MFRLAFVAPIAILLSSCASPGQMGVSKLDWKQARPGQKKQWRQTYKKYQEDHPVLIGDSQSNDLHLAISGGKALFPPLFHAFSYEPISVILNSGACKRVEIHSTAGSMSNWLYACYANNTLALDPSIQNIETSNGSLVITYSPLWLRPDGWTYPSMTSDGLLSLSGAAVRISLVKNKSLL
jgi:hypothetical protein